MTPWFLFPTCLALWGSTNALQQLSYTAHTDPGYKKEGVAFFEQPKSLTEVTHILMNTLCSPTDGWCGYYEWQFVQ